MNFARRDSGHLVMSAPSTLIFPESTKKEPATAFNSVDFPDPFVPMMMTNDPSWTFSPTSRSARSSLGVPALKILLTLAISSMGRSGVHPLLQRAQPFQQCRRNQCEKNEHCRRQFQIIGIQSNAQRNCHQ